MTRENRTLYHESEFTVGKYTFVVRFERDDDMREPWVEHDGHGIVSKWTARDKSPGELILTEDHGSKRYYDYQETLKVARRDGWSCDAVLPGDTAKQKAHKAVMADYDYLRAWCQDEWEWTFVEVHLKDDPEMSDAMGGVESKRIEVERPDVVLSEN
jgi:hypothetical protein